MKHQIGFICFPFQFPNWIFVFHKCRVCSFSNSTLNWIKNLQCRWKSDEKITLQTNRVKGYEILADDGWKNGAITTFQQLPFKFVYFCPKMKDENKRVKFWKLLSLKWYPRLIYVSYIIRIFKTDEIFIVARLFWITLSKAYIQFIYTFNDSHSPLI